MACEHKRLRCTDNVFYCMDCGAVVPNPYENDKQEGQEEKPAETQQTSSGAEAPPSPEGKARKRKRKESE